MQSEKDALIERYAGGAFKNRNNHDLTIGVWRQHFVEFADKLAALSAAKPQPAPSVAVKALEWKGPTPETNGCHVAETIFGTYSAVNEDGWYVTLDDHPWGQGFEWSAPDMRMTFDDAAKAAQADYEARIRSALSAQVQDVAGLLDETWNAAVEQAAAIANDCVHLTPDPGAAIRTMLNGRSKLHPAAPAKQEG